MGLPSLVTESVKERLSIQQLARREGVHLSTVWRWCLRGCKGHKLESLSIGGKRFTTQAAFERFIARINGEPATSPETPRQREAAIERAERELDRLGI